MNEDIKVYCSRCGRDLEPEAISSGWCWSCGNMGVVEFKAELTD